MENSINKCKGTRHSLVVATCWPFSMLTRRQFSKNANAKCTQSWLVGGLAEAPISISIFIFISTERRFLAPPPLKICAQLCIQKGIGALKMEMAMGMGMGMGMEGGSTETSPLGHGSRRGCRLAGASYLHFFQPTNIQYFFTINKNQK